MYYNTDSKRDVLWARPCGGLRPMYLRRPDPLIWFLHPSPFSSACSPSLVPSSLGSVLWVTGCRFASRGWYVVDSFVFVAGWGCFPRPLRWGWAIVFACMCCAIVIVCDCVGTVFYVRSSGEFSLNETCWAISATVLVWKLPVLLMTIGMICTCSRSLLCCSMTCLSGS